jgi:ABC-type nitrate/sulfonate/bicarbonate transport system substrate-binding protein
MPVTALQPERRRLRVGYMPLIDAAPLLWARHRGYFADMGLDVELIPEVSWASLRDRLAYGALDAAQCLAPMPLAATLGIDGVGVPMLSALGLSRGGSGVTLGRAFARRLGVESGTPPLDTARAICRHAARGEPVCLGHVFAFSMHHYLMRYWLRLGGSEAAETIHFRVAPPPQMVRLLEAGAVDGFCAGEPWNTVALRGGLGMPVVATHDIWAGGPEKVLGVTRDWAETHPQAHRALVAALLRAQKDFAEGVVATDSLAALFRDAGALDLPQEWIAAALTGEAVEAPRFFPENAGLRPSQMLWCLMQMLLTAQCQEAVDPQVVKAVCDTVCFLDAAAAAGLSLPTPAARAEGGDSVEAGDPSRFLAGPVLSPEDPVGYLVAHGMPEARARALILRRG